MKSRNQILMCLVALLVIAGCASTKITGRDELATGQLPRPNTIWVHDFAATPDEVPNESALAGQDLAHSAPQTPKEIATGRQLGAEIASQLIEQINDLVNELPRSRAAKYQKEFSFNPDAEHRGILLIK